MATVAGTRTIAILSAAVGAILVGAPSAQAAPGDLDPGFGMGGLLFPDAPAAEGASDLLVEPGGNFVVGGSVRQGNRLRPAVLRFLPNGAPDPSFGSGGTVVFDFEDAYGDAAVVRQPDG